MKRPALLAAALCASALTSLAAPAIDLSPVPATASAVNLPPAVLTPLYPAGAAMQRGASIKIAPRSVQVFDLR
jgi:hypothetical protein